MASNLDQKLQVFRAYFFQMILQYSRQHSSFQLTRLLYDKDWLHFSIIFFFIPREASFESSLTVAWFSCNNHISVLRITTNEIALFRIDTRLLQMAFLRVRNTRLSPPEAPFLFLPHFDIICDILLNRRTATWNLFVNYLSPDSCTLHAYHFLNITLLELH